MKKSQEAGFSLVELMVGLTIGLVILVGVTNLFSSSLYSNLNGAREQQFEHSLRVLVYDITSEIRRAGAARTGATLTQQSNGKYYDSSTTAGCILFSHSTPSFAEQFYGYRLNGNVIEYYASTSPHTNGSCTLTTGWTPITDPLTIKITSLTFTDGPLVKITIEAESIKLKIQDGTAVKRVISSSVLIRNA